MSGQAVNARGVGAGAPIGPNGRRGRGKGGGGGGGVRKGQGLDYSSGEGLRWPHSPNGMIWVRKGPNKSPRQTKRP